MADQQEEPRPASGESWERDLLQRLAFASINEQRRARRWNLLFRGLLLGYLFIVLLMFARPFETGGGAVGRHTALVDVDGMIAAGGPADADTIISGLRSAFEAEDVAGVILRINSPGGSPVQAGYVYDELRRLKADNPEIPVYAVAGDLCASGGYYIAAGADAIYANRATMIGSIGVLMNGFGFVGTMDKLGVERRLYTAGEQKGFLDPFQPANPDEVAHLRTMLADIHEQFATAVKEGRGDRLKGGEELFSGLIWTGQQAIELGLVDGLGSAGYVAREVIGADKVVDYSREPDFFERFARQLGTGAASVIVQQLSGPLLQ